MNRVIVIGGNHHNTLGVLRSLGEKNINADLVLVSDKTNNYVHLSKYINKCIVLQHDEDIVSYLLERKNNVKTILISCSDKSSSVIDLNRDKLTDYYIMPGTEVAGALTAYMDKLKMIEFAVSVGLPCISSLELPKDLHKINGLEYPCILKPLISKNGSKADIRICLNRTEIEEILQSCDQQRYLAQHYIDKDFEYQLIGCSLDSGNEIIIPGVSKIIRSHSGSNTGYLHYEPIGSIDGIPVDKCKDFIKKIGYSGLFSIEFIHTSDGESYFLEINFRNDGNAICVTASGVNLPYIWYLYNIGDKSYRDEMCRQIHSVYVMPEFDDFTYMIKYGDGVWTWIKDVYNTDCYMEFDIHDIHPFIARLKQFVGQRLIKFISH